MASVDTTGGLVGNLLERLHSPTQLRAFVTCAMLLVGYGAVFAPLDSSINDTNRRLTQERKRLNLAREIEHLRAQDKRYEGFLPKQQDRNEWVEYVLSGIRPLPLKLVVLEAKTSDDMGAVKAVVFHCELEGAFSDIESLVRWIEFNERIFRIDSLKISPHRSNNGTLVAQLVIVGVMG
jgi:hypothetical protein